MDSRDLIEERDLMKQEILDSFLEEFPEYADMTDSFEDIRFEEEELESWKEYWQEELEQIAEINSLEEEISSSEWDYGISFIEEDQFEDYCEELVKDIGYLSTNLPSFIENNIDWKGVADDLRVDYSEVEFRQTTYLYRA